MSASQRIAQKGATTEWAPELRTRIRRTARNAQFQSLAATPLFGSTKPSYVSRPVQHY